MRMTVVKSISFDAAHFLPDYKGKCSNTHGHHWIVELAIEGEVNKNTGMVIDFALLNGFLKHIEDQLDHTLINDTIPNPTAENICLFVADELRGDDWGFAPNWKFIKVWETENSYALLSC